MMVPPSMLSKLVQVKGNHLRADYFIFWTRALPVIIILMETIKHLYHDFRPQGECAPVGMSWMWTMLFDSRWPTDGYAATREAAMRAFAKSWRRAKRRSAKRPPDVQALFCRRRHANARPVKPDCVLKWA